MCDTNDKAVGRAWPTIFPAVIATSLLGLLMLLFHTSPGVGADGEASAIPIRIHYEPAIGELGDPIPFFWNGVYHVFYLKKEENRPITWAHISSRDLVRWREHPDAIDGCLTGSIIEKDGLFHAFTTEGGSVGHATSRDLDTWEKDGGFLLSLDPRWYEASWRDPCVVWNPKDRQYWMAICGRAKGDVGNPMTGCVALATSPDLAKWTVQPPLWAPQFSTWLECPDLFPYGDTWVLLYHWRQTRARLADAPLGPWLRPTVESPDGWNCAAAKTMFDGNRRILIGWIPRRPCSCGLVTGGCTLLLPREWYLAADNTPVTRPAAEVVAAFKNDATQGQGAKVFKPVMSEWELRDDSAVGRPKPGESALAVWRDAPANCYFRTEIQFSPHSRATILLRGQSADTAYGYKTALDTGYGVYLDPNRGTVELRRWYEWDQVGPINETAFSFSLDRPTVIEMFVDNDILEVFLDGRQSLVGRIPENAFGSLGILTQDGPATFKQITVRTIEPR